MKLRTVGATAGAFLAVVMAAPVVSGGSATGDPASAVAIHQPYRDLPFVSVDELRKPALAGWSGVADGRGHRATAGNPGRIAPMSGSAEPARSPEWGSYDVLAGDAAPQPSEVRLEIRLQQAHFDPKREGMSLFPALAGDTHGEGDSDYRIVQFEGPIRSEWRTALEAGGVEIIDYVPDFAYVVRVGMDRVAALDAFEGVRWVGAFAPAFRLDNELVEAALAGRSDQWLSLLVRGFAGEPGQALRQSLVQAGAGIVEQGQDSGGGVLFEIHAPASALLTIAATRAVAWIEPKRELALANSVARSEGMTGKDLVEQRYSLFGGSQIVAVVDSGLSTGNPSTPHADFAGRVLGGSFGGGNCGGWHDTNGHGTHVAGSVLGSGVRSGGNPNNNQFIGSQAGLAPKAGLLVWAVCDNFSGLPQDMYANLWTQIYGFHGAVRTSNNSWGTNGSAGIYNVQARETDRFVRNHADMVIVFAAGNDGKDANGDGVSDMGTVQTPGSAKNIITVGASENYRSSGGYNPGGNCAFYGECWPQSFPVAPIAQDRISDNPNGMVGFSGRGPTRSGRLKPDIVAPGTNIASALSEHANPNNGWGPGNQYYYFQGGTSMASPLVAGGAAVVRDYFATLYQHNPSASLVKAVLLNGAYDMSPGQYGTGPQRDVLRRPDVHQGWGTLYLPTSLFSDDNVGHAYYEVFPGIATNQQWQSQITVEAGGSLRIIAVWIDAPGTEASHGALVNDLDLEVVDPSNTVHYGFAGLVGQQRDRYNNAEGVTIASAPAGTYTLRVRGHNVPMGPQHFSIAVRGNLADNDVIFRNGFQSGG